MVMNHDLLLSGVFLGKYKHTFLDVLVTTYNIVITAEVSITNPKFLDYTVQLRHSQSQHTYTYPYNAKYTNPTTSILEE